MGEESVKKRRYDSTRRKESARETEREIVQAARKLFIERGWNGTTVEAIAQEAGVAVETIYSVFHNKHAILARLVQVAVRSDYGPTPILERAQPQAMQKETSQRGQLETLARGIAEIMERAGPIFGVMRAAAQTEPEIEELQSAILKERLANMARVVGWVAANGPLRGNLDGPQAAEIVWLLTSAEVHHLLTVDLGWCGEKYGEWLADKLITLLLPK
jgi:AcrR family transcriptional regulator